MIRFATPVNRNPRELTMLAVGGSVSRRKRHMPESYDRFATLAGAVVYSGAAPTVLENLRRMQKFCPEDSRWSCVAQEIERWQEERSRTLSPVSAGMMDGQPYYCQGAGGLCSNMITEGKICSECEEDLR